MNLDTYKLLDGQDAFSELHSTLTSVCLSAGRAFGSTECVCIWEKQNKTQPTSSCIFFYNMLCYLISYPMNTLYYIYYVLAVIHTYIPEKALICLC